MHSKNYNEILILGAAAAVVLIGGVWAFLNSPFTKGLPADEAGSTRVGEGEGILPFVKGVPPSSAGRDFSKSSAEDGTSFNKGGISQGDIGTAEIANIQPTDFTETYKNAKYRFSFKYPSDYAVTILPDEGTGGDIVLIQKKDGKSGVQIAVSPFDEPNAVLTPNRVEQEAGITVESPQDVLIGAHGKGLAFIGRGTDFGTSREVWFVFGTTLYQMSTYIELDELLKNVLGTWQFN